MVVGGSRLYNIVIIGSGIAGSSLAFELGKRNQNYLIYTNQEGSLQNTSSLSYGHCRIPISKELEEIINKSVFVLGENEKRVRFIYSNADLVLDLFKELDIDFEYRSFGIIPLYKKMGGRMILERIQEHIPSIETGTEFVDFERTGDEFKIKLKKNNKYFQVRSRYLVLATGGNGGTFRYTDNFRYKSNSVFDIVKKNSGEIINTDCVFIHPFGYQNGRKILIGNESKDGEFIDSHGNFIFDKETRKSIKTNNYHEVFDDIIRQMEKCRKNDLKVYFINSSKKIEIVPTVHYTSGGIETDYLGEVINIKGLFAVGECKADGSKNGGRFPGYPFTSSIVCARFLADKFSGI